MTMQTRTGNFPIGFRRGGSAWQKDLASLIDWTKQNGLAGIDIGADVEDGQADRWSPACALAQSTCKDNKGMISPDKTKRESAIAANVAQIEAGAKLGAVNYFLVMLPEKPDLPRAENFGYMVESFSALAPALEKAQCAHCD